MSELHLYNPTCAREFESMTTKAMFAYAEWQTFSDPGYLGEFFDGEDMETSAMLYKSEFEAVTECMAMFTRELRHQVRSYVIERARRELM